MASWGTVIRITAVVAPSANTGPRVWNHWGWWSCMRDVRIPAGAGWSRVKVKSTLPPSRSGPLAVAVTVDGGWGQEGSMLSCTMSPTVHRTSVELIKRVCPCPSEYTPDKEKEVEPTQKLRALNAESGVPTRKWTISLLARLKIYPIR